MHVIFSAFLSLLRVVLLACGSNAGGIQDNFNEQARQDKDKDKDK